MIKRELNILQNAPYSAHYRLSKNIEDEIIKKKYEGGSKYVAR